MMSQVQQCISVLDAIRRPATEPASSSCYEDKVLSEPEPSPTPALLHKERGNHTACTYAQILATLINPRRQEVCNTAHSEPTAAYLTICFRQLTVNYVIQFIHFNHSVLHKHMYAHSVQQTKK
jgi:hypothetical protein